MDSIDVRPRVRRPLQIPAQPFVSVIIPFFNREGFLSEAIESVLKQTEPIWELLLVDDGSTDQSHAIAAQFANQHPDQIQVLTHPCHRNEGVGASRNLAIRQASGQYIMFLDSDDVLFPEAIAQSRWAFDANPKADVVCGACQCWFSWSDDASHWERDFIVDLLLEPEQLYAPQSLLLHNLRVGGRKPAPSGMMLKRDFILKTGVVGDRFRQLWEDQAFWAKVSLYGHIFVMDACVVRYRQHPAAVSTVMMQAGRDMKEMSYFLTWLEAYLQAEGIQSAEIAEAVTQFRRKIQIDIRLKQLKQFYRRMLPLYLRYELRNRWARWMQLLGSTHGQK